MKLSFVSLCTAAMLAVAVPALAQEKDSSPSQVPIPRGVFVKGQVAGQYLARDHLIGTAVLDSNGKIVGDIDDLIVGPNHEIQGVVIGTGGFLGIGEKQVGVRISALQLSQKDGRTLVTLPAATREVLAALEPFKRAEPRRSALDRAKDFTDRTKDSAGPAYERAKEKAQQAYESAREQAGPAYEQAKTAAKEAYDKAMQAAREAYQKATEQNQQKQ